jgi:hypothetical protein
VTKASKTPVACLPVGPWSLAGWYLAWPDAYVFVAGEVLLDLSCRAAAARLADLARGGSLTRASQEAYDDGLTGLVRVGPVGAAAGMSKLVEVHFLEVATRGESAVLAPRWEATGPGGRLFPALDADMSLTPRRAAFRPAIAGRGLPAPARCPGRGPGPRGRSRGGDATARSLLARVADVLGPSPGAGRRRAANRHDQGCRAPGSTRNAPTRLPSARRIGLAEIEHDVPDIPDRQVQLADGVLDLPGSRMVTQQP